MTTYFTKGDVTLRDSYKDDIKPVAADMRKADADEVWASNLILPQEALEIGLHYSKYCFTITYKGFPVAMLGIVADPQETKKACVWLLGTRELDRLTLRFCKISKQIMSLLLGFYPLLYNYVDERNMRSILWLKWCGAKFADAAPYGKAKLPFKFFTIERNL